MCHFFLILTLSNILCPCPLLTPCLIISPPPAHFHTQTSFAQSLGILVRSLLEFDDSGAKVTTLTSAPFDGLEFAPTHAAAAIGQLLSLVGFTCVRNPDMQKAFANAPEVEAAIPLLVFLCRNMPDRYYTQERFKSQLLPTIAAMCEGCTEALTVLDREIDSGLITTHLASLSRELEDFKRECSNAADPSLLQPKLSLMEVSARFPTELWDITFRKD